MPVKNDPQVLCRTCDKRMGRLTWMTQKECDNPNCKCPEVQKLIQATKNVISKAQGYHMALEVKRGAVPHGYDANTTQGQYVIPMPDVKLMIVTPTKRK